MITLKHVQSGSHQYSCRCGWIDKDHASMDDAGPEDDIRLDVIANWKQFPTQPNARRSPDGTGWLINYKQPVGIMSNVAAFTFPTGWYIKDLPRGAEAYRAVALRLYQLANDHLEQLQGGPSEPIRHSSFSYEDLSSNMIAWYRGVLGYTRARVNDICQTISKEQSVELARAIGIDNILDKNREWGKTLLFSDKCEECTRRGSTGSGMVDMPAEFGVVTPGSVTFKPGSGDAWPPEFDPSLRSHPYDRYHLPWWDRPLGHHPPSPLADLWNGILGRGRRPGPQGRR